MTVLLYVLIAVGVAALLFALSTVVFGRGEPLPPVGPDSTVAVLPEGGLTGADLDSVSFSISVRGYRMDEVDGVLDRAGAEIDRLRAELRGNGRRSGGGSDSGLQSERDR